ncbi:hypothetical protein A1359_12080 [Methylomonas lenta]|uniref:Uncharacterized protein n=2 Tax=Methylomonas lenta TaxID=980561 RepID=A0A177N743_9GAMM|nr:hypothetical protein A1359_12080 [Methylomonas lenta]
MKPTTIIFLAFSVLLEIPIAMIYLARFAPYRINRWVNIAAVAVTFLFVLGGRTLIPLIFFLQVWGNWNVIYRMACLEMEN